MLIAQAYLNLHQIPIAFLLVLPRRTPLVAVASHSSRQTPRQHLAETYFAITADNLHLTYTR